MAVVVAGLSYRVGFGVMLVVRVSDGIEVVLESVSGSESGSGWWVRFRIWVGVNAGTCNAVRVASSNYTEADHRSIAGARSDTPPDPGAPGTAGSPRRERRCTCGLRRLPCGSLPRRH